MKKLHHIIKLTLNNNIYIYGLEDKVLPLFEEFTIKEKIN